jgi:hypothetical protein
VIESLTRPVGLGPRDFPEGIQLLKARASVYKTDNVMWVDFGRNDRQAQWNPKCATCDYCQWRERSQIATPHKSDTPDQCEVIHIDT